MRSKRDMVLRALERGIEVSLEENRYVFDDNGDLAILVQTSSDGENWEERAYLSDITFGYFTKMCNELSDEYIMRINFSTAMEEMKNDRY